MEGVHPATADAIHQLQAMQAELANETWTLQSNRPLGQTMVASWFSVVGVWQRLVSTFVNDSEEETLTKMELGSDRILAAYQTLWQCHSEDLPPGRDHFRVEELREDYEDWV